MPRKQSAKSQNQTSPCLYSIKKFSSKPQSFQKSMIVSKNLVAHKETAVVSSFINKILETVLGYKTIGSGKNYTLAQEYQIAKGAVDTALGEFFNDKQGDKIHAVFELKGAKAKNLDNLISGRKETPVEQAWRYARDVQGCQWILITNYLEIRLYAYGETSLIYEGFDLAKLTEPAEYARFLLCLHADNLLTGNTKNLLEQSKQAEKDITAKLYDDYKTLRELLIKKFIEDNPEIAPLALISPAQKLLDRVLFVAFCEDKGLLPPKSIEQAVKHVEIYNPIHPIYQNFKGLFQGINKGNAFLNVSAYNGGLFATDKLLDKLIVADELCKGFLKLAEYDFDSEVSVTVLGHIFEQSISDLEEISAQIQTDGVFKSSAKTTSVSGKRKQHGVVYTPDHITAFIVEHTLGEYLRQRFDECLTPFGIVDANGEIQWKESTITPAKKIAKKEKTPEQIEKELKKNEAEKTRIELTFWYEWQAVLKTIKIVDPACGSGAFLVAAFDLLQQKYQQINTRIAELTGSFGIFDLNKEILNSNLSGVDLNAEAIEITKLSLWLKTAERGKKLATIDQHLQVGNSLGFDSPVNLTGLEDLSVFCWKNNFSKILKSGGFDVVLGNPPYVRQELLSDFKPYLQKNYAVYHGVADLYAYFFELGLKLLKPNGMLGFISSSTFFKTSSGEPLRRFLHENATLKKVVDFGDLQVFEGVTTYPAILIFQNAKPLETSEIRMLVLTDKLPDDLKETFKNQHGIMAHSQLRADSWQLEDARLNQLRGKLTNGFPTLKEVYGSPLYGIKTGLNEAFVIDGETKKSLVLQDPNSAELLKPFLEGKDLKKWHSQPRDLWLVLMPKGWTQKKMSGLFDESNSWQWLQNNYSGVAQWLEPFAEAARKRTDKGDFWWELRACAYYDLFEKPQIVYPVISQGAKFSIENTIAFSNDKTFMLMSADSFGLGLLNSKVIWFIVSKTFSSLRGGIWRFELRGQDMEKLPIPPATDQQKLQIGQLAEQCQTLSEARYKLEKDTQFSIADLGVKKLTQKLEKWWDLEFKDFLDELKKSAKVEIELRKHSEWRDFLTDAKTKHQAFSQQIAILELQLNTAIYQLFNLTAEEIKLIEAN
jgi:type I restriction-modification system DNA methylase subunit